MVRRTAVLSCLVGAALTICAAACGGDGSVATQPSRQPTAAPGSSSPAVVADPIRSGPLEAGTYLLEDFAEPMTLTLGDGWEAVTSPKLPAGSTRLGEAVFMINGDHPAANLAIIQPGRVVDPAKDWDEDGNIVPLPPDLIEWFADHPHHEAEAQTETVVAGRDARSVDIVVATVPKNGWPSCGGKCVLWFPLDVDNESGPVKTDDLVFGGALGEHDRQVVVDLDGQPLVIDIGAFDSKSFEKFLLLADEVLSTLTIG